jgi:amidase
VPGTWTLRVASGGVGLRVGVKDLIDVAGSPTTAGSLALARHATPAHADAACLAGLRAAEAAGIAHLVGKTGLHELAYGITGINHAFGTPTNPLDPGRVPGGSSSGSAVAVACGEADVAYGTDTGGSIRIPAACCGVAGLKTTWGRIPTEGVRPLAPSLDTVGPLARDVAGLVAGMRLLEPGFEPAALGSTGDELRVGRLRPDADPCVDRAVERALRSTGWTVVETPISAAVLDDAAAAALTLLDAEAWATNGHLATGPAAGALGDDVARRLSGAARIPEPRVHAARAAGRRWRAQLAGVFGEVDLLVLPTLLGFPPVLDDAGRMAACRGATAAVNLAGVPALSLPVRSDGPLPAALQLVGPHGADALVLAAGAWLEAAAAAA